MDPLELEYDDINKIPEPFRPLYTDDGNGHFTLGNINGLKTVKDTTALTEALRKERSDHAAARDALKPWSGMKHVDVMASLDRIKELELAAGGAIDETKLAEIVEGRLAQKTGPLQRSIDTLTGERDTAILDRDLLTKVLAGRDLSDAIRGVAIEMKVIPSAIGDVEIIAERYLEKSDNGQFIVKADAIGVTPGLDVKGFMKEMQKVRPHWWPASTGGGAGGGGANFGGADNPWSADHWNMTKQGQLVRSDRALAEKMALAAGSKIGAIRPAKKK